MSAPSELDPLPELPRIGDFDTWWELTLLAMVSNLEGQEDLSRILHREAHRMEKQLAPLPEKARRAGDPLGTPQPNTYGLNTPPSSRYGGWLR